MKTAAIERVVRLRIAITEGERALARQLRHTVFCREQGLFSDSDHDAIDEIALPLLALFQSNDHTSEHFNEEANEIANEVVSEVVGTVRIHEAARGLWFGSRLAVSTNVRRSGVIGSGLIRLAVGIAKAHGCKTFLAHVQTQNVPMFERLHWQSHSEEFMHGRPHHLMQADLSCYAPIVDGDIGLLLPVPST